MKDSNAGRKQRITDEKSVETIILAISMGMSTTQACKLAKWSDTTFYKYIKLGEEDSEKELDTEYSRFLYRIREANAKCEAALTQKIIDYMERRPDDIDTVFRFLQTRFHRDWNPATRMSVESKTLNLNVLITPEEKKRIEDELGFISQKRISKADLPVSVDGDKPPQDSQPEEHNV